MNKPEFAFSLGFLITIINMISLSCCVFVVARQFNKVIKLRGDFITVNFHFVLLLIAFAFGFGNGLATARFFQAWMIEKHVSTLYLQLNGFSDRIFMCITSIGLLVLSLLKVPFLIEDDPK